MLSVEYFEVKETVLQTVLRLMRFVLRLTCTLMAPSALGETTRNTIPFPAEAKALDPEAAFESLHTGRIPHTNDSPHEGPESFTWL